MKYHVSLDIDLRRNPYKGLYIALEGTEASGKTTQVERLKEYFKKKGRTVVTTREPRKEGFIGDLIHQILLGKKDFSSKALQYLFTTDRVLNQEEVVLPALKKGNVVISDRVFWSGVVYGVLDRMEKKYDINSSDYLFVAYSILSFYHQFVAPDYTFYLKISHDVSVRRLQANRKGREIYEDKEKIKKIIEGYNWLAKKFENEIITVDGEQPIGEVSKQILKHVSSIM